MSVTWKARPVAALIVGSIVGAGVLYVAYHLFLQFLLGLFQFQT